MMSEAGSGKGGEELHEHEALDCNIDSQTSNVIQSSFLRPLQDSQETQDELSKWRDVEEVHNETAGVSQPTQISQRPFLSRPHLENPEDFQAGFQYTKPPTPQTLPHHSIAPRESLGIFNGPKANIAIRPGSLLQVLSNPTFNDPPAHPREASEKETQIDRLRPNQAIQEDSELSVPKCSLSNVKVPEGTQRNERDSVITQNGFPQGPPFKTISHLQQTVTPTKQIRTHGRSPVSRSQKIKHSKAISDIQRKALILSSPRHRHNHPKPLGKFSTGEALSPELERETFPQAILNDTQETSHTGARKFQGKPSGDLAFHQTPKSPKKGRPVKPLRKDRSHATTMTRPSNGVHHTNRFMQSRPTSQASNISKVRGSRSLKYTDVQRSQPSPNLRESRSLQANLGRTWNDFFSYSAALNEHWETKMAAMEEQLTTQDTRIGEYLAEIQKRDQVITELKNANEEDCALYEEQEARLAKSERRRQRLQGKMSEYKDHLNKATDEQQKIFKYCKARYQQAVDEMKGDEQNRQNAVEMALAATNEARDRIQKSVTEVKSLAQIEIQKLNSEIESLKIELAERESEVDREKEYTSGLCRELAESHKLREEVFKSLKTQYQQLIEKNDQGITQAQAMESYLKQQDQKIESMLEIMEANRASTSDTSQMMESLKVLSEFRKHEESDRELSSTSTKSLKTEISAIRKLCDDLTEQVQSNRQSSEWQEKYHQAQMECKSLSQEMAWLEEKLVGMRNEAKAQSEQQQDLQQELFTLRANAKATNESERRAENLERAKEELKQSLNEKAFCIRGLEEKLRLVNEELNAQTRRLHNQEIQIVDEQEKHRQEIKMSYEQREQAIKQAVSEESARVRTNHQKIEKQLERDRSELQEELTRANEAAESALKKNTDEDLRHVQEALTSTKTLMDKLTGDLKISEQSQTDLQARLEAWSNDHIKIAQLQQVVQKFAKDQQEVIGNGEQLEELLEMQKNLDNTWQWHKSEVDLLVQAIEGKGSPSCGSNDQIKSGSCHGHGLSDVITMLRDEDRRVTIHSPANDGESMAPVSVEEERFIRRQAVAPRGIMKQVQAVAKTEGGQLEEQDYKPPQLANIMQAGTRSNRRAANCTPKSAPVSRSAYNRPVLGNTLHIKDKSNDPIGVNTETVSVSGKRKGNENNNYQQDYAKGAAQEPFAAKRHRSVGPRSKLSGSMSEYFQFLVHGESEPQPQPIQPQAQLGLLTGAPLEKRSRSIITYGSQDSEAIRARSTRLTMAVPSEDQKSSTHSFDLRR
ncbi:hypothetical protein F5Y19DRAFT_485192 [Xylariaceae sp. FL1651]|nr:hypothetical protein F5Y19DRAFT_485192 [Xylariaceae sp. FL1651]